MTDNTKKLLDEAMELSGQIVAKEEKIGTDMKFTYPYTETADMSDCRWSCLRKTAMCVSVQKKSLSNI